MKKIDGRRTLRHAIGSAGLQSGDLTMRQRKHNVKHKLIHTSVDHLKINIIYFFKKFDEF